MRTSRLDPRGRNRPQPWEACGARRLGMTSGLLVKRSPSSPCSWGDGARGGRCPRNVSRLLVTPSKMPPNGPATARSSRSTRALGTAARWGLSPSRSTSRSTGCPASTSRSRRWRPTRPTSTRTSSRSSANGAGNAVLNGQRLRQLLAGRGRCPGWPRGLRSRRRVRDTRRRLRSRPHQPRPREQCSRAGGARPGSRRGSPR